MRTHRIVVKTDSLQKTATGISFIAQCCGDYEESFHFERVGNFSTEELHAKIQQALEKSKANHEHKLAGEDHVEALLKMYAEGIPSCKECG